MWQEIATYLRPFIALQKPSKILSWMIFQSGACSEIISNR